MRSDFATGVLGVVNLLRFYALRSGLCVATAGIFTWLALLFTEVSMPSEAGYA